MAASKRYMNTRSVVATPTTGSPATATGVTNFSIDQGISLQDFSGDADRGPTLIVNDFINPTLSFTTADLSFAGAVGVTWRGSLSGVSKDARNQSATLASGDIAWTLSNAVVASNSFSAGHRQFASANLSFRAEVPDGYTPSLSFSVSA